MLQYLLCVLGLLVVVSAVTIDKRETAHNQRHHLEAQTHSQTHTQQKHQQQQQQQRKHNTNVKAKEDFCGDFSDPAAEFESLTSGLCQATDLTNMCTQSPSYTPPAAYQYTYVQSTGQFYGPAYDGSGTINWLGCSGANYPPAGSPAGTAPCRNNPDDNCVKNCGPVPRGSYTIGPDSVFKGMKHCYHLAPDTAAQMCTPARDGIVIHGGDCTTGNPSIGCIIIKDENIRQLIKGTVGKLNVVQDAPSDAPPLPSAVNTGSVIPASFNPAPITAPTTPTPPSP